jgi:integrase
MRELCKFLAAEDPRTSIPPTHSFAIRRPTFVPRVLSLAEASSFLDVCSSLPPGRCSPLRGTVHGTALTLLYLTGVRVGEALALTLDDVDLLRNVLHIRKGKFGKARFVPIAPDLGGRLRHCRERVREHFGIRSGVAPFFPGPKGRACTRGALSVSFRSSLRKIGISPSLTERLPRVHDLRHAYACHRMILWFRQGANLEAKLPLLATYLGHVGLSSSQRYLRLTEDLLGEVTRRHQARFGYLIQERETP